MQLQLSFCVHFSLTTLEGKDVYSFLKTKSVDLRCIFKFVLGHTDHIVLVHFIKKKTFLSALENRVPVSCQYLSPEFCHVIADHEPVL